MWLKKKQKKTDFVTRVKVLTGAFMQNVVEGAIRHPVCDDDRVRGRRQTCSQHGEDIRMGKYPGMEPKGGGKGWRWGGREGRERDRQKDAEDATHRGFDINRQPV